MFAGGHDSSPAACAVYALSAYSVGVAAWRWTPPLWRAARRLRMHPLLRRWNDDAALRAGAAFAVTAAYCAYNAVLAVHLRSAWIGSMALYWLILGGLRLALLRHARLPEGSVEPYRTCGLLLLALTFSLSVVSFHAIYRGGATSYPGHTIYAAAGFTFYTFTMAVMRLRRGDAPDHTARAGRLLSLATALVSVFFLQTAMLAQFGDSAPWQAHLNMATGGAAFAGVLVIAIYMMRAAAR